MPTISRKEYASLFGPTVGDKIRLGETDLYIEIEKDLRGYGDESVYGGGKSLRDGMGSNNTLTRDNGVLDLVITNVTILDADSTHQAAALVAEGKARACLTTRIAADLVGLKTLDVVIQTIPMLWTVFASKEH